jgi:hypothetical protein
MKESRSAPVGRASFLTPFYINENTHFSYIG